MALTRKFLSAMGIEDDKAEQIINAHLETVNPLKQERDDYKEKTENAASIQKELDAAKAKLKEYEESGEKDSWKVKYDSVVAEKKKVQKDFDDYKADVAAKELTAKKKEAYRALLKETGVSDKRLDAVLKVTDLSGIELDEEGKIKDSDKKVESIKSEWADFIGQVGQTGVQTPTPQGTNGSGNAANPNVGRPISRAAQLAQNYRNTHYGTPKEG